MINEVIAGVVGGIAYSLSGWISTSDKFDWLKLTKSVVISGITGAICAATGMQFDVAIVGTLGIGVTAFVNKIVKIFQKRIR